ncbi:dipeptide/oligopeptide/nickel ABC transporter permease/ATP-binding protein [Micromonospora peucetia]|uniref:Dipeptide/oligopeptide/nickel ABC transporter permease/ATP-binding protein n=1 Tax=Micromonospora peucetia TaxID=47871 RepID=A0A1C6U2L9_9ACTN|nr:dipeptide/oligopeptide/nickel ABC transporter permease/ATP-binding protein [Micromonospora peucetia]MCX4385956.1 dipeptide/oligopeptide/nickel ABC transporter permease/ATP-binding protein [Micromonospora peucetia]WSA33326.1 dipeptide/oligopeptide/nickel ABC transporter permease/ATP-binding protein [Micromonospora peucetia]SCL48264.1 peptide/nickel transport system permease protein [Micromonospora peucetia]
MSVTFRRFVRHKVGMGALAVLLIVILVAIIVPPLWPYDYTDITPELSQSPSLQHPMGTDTLGRDLFALVLRGMQQSLLIAGSVTIIACVIGVVMGVAAGYFGRFVDAAVMRTVDLVLTLPTIALAAFLGSLVAGKGVSWLGLAMVLGALMWTSVARLVRGVVLGMRELAFVDAARVMGASPIRIMFRHLVPNASDHIVVSGTLMFGVAILAESSLSFLGFGVQPPDTSLGLLVANAQSAVLTRPWLFYFPGLLIITIVLSVNYVGEGLRDAFNPKSSPTNPLATPRRLRRRKPHPVSGDPAPGQKPLLKVSDLSVRFGEHIAVDAVNLEVKPGEVVALVGESGSGKSLTALSLVGLLPSNAVGSGSINFDGAELSGLSFAQWREYRGRRIAMILQDPSTTLNPVLTIGAQFADSMALARTVKRAEARRRAIELMESVAIKDAEARLDQYPHQLSGGMRQRIAIALAMVHDPDLIIADEPTTALDVTVQAQVMATLALARERTGAAMLFITHDLALVAGIADRVAVMYQGEIVEHRDVFAIFDNPESDYTRKLLSLAPRITSQAVEGQ